MDNPPSSRHWPLFLVGAFVFLLGPIGYVAQVSLGQIESMPWYIFGFSAVGLALMLASVRQRGGALRIIGLGFFVLFLAFECLVLLVFSRSPEYEGTVQTGSNIPAFTTSLADGRSFTHADLKAGQPTVLIFYRGHW